MHHVDSAQFRPELTRSSPQSECRIPADPQSVLLEAYAINDHPQPLVPAAATRGWMDEFTDHHAYRCLPLAIGNTYGWQLMLPVDVDAAWNGGPAQDDVRVSCAHPHQAISNFRHGVITFDVSYIFRTSPGYHLLVMGPSNTVKDGVAPMTAVIEADWLPYTFTFNYVFTRPGRVTWKAGEPYAQICVVAANLQNQIQPVIRKLSDNSTLHADHLVWRKRRAELASNRSKGNRTGASRAWDKDYFLGRYGDGRPTQAAHTMKVRLRQPLDARGDRKPHDP
jgi:Family of unknown function (DUF6065)